MPILPMFIVALGGGGLALGIIGGLRDSIAGVLKIVCGYFSDKTGRRDRKSTRLNSSHTDISRMPSSA